MSAYKQSGGGSVGRRFSRTLSQAELRALVNAPVLLVPGESGNTWLIHDLALRRSAGAGVGVAVARKRTAFMLAFYRDDPPAGGFSARTPPAFLSEVYRTEINGLTSGGPWTYYVPALGGHGVGTGWSLWMGRFGSLTSSEERGFASIEGSLDVIVHASRLPYVV